ncbi:hypothetical protein BBJ28_00001270 [Nothophytophthora sp. Chile5]|nr:hypothetical protein BBJ28_00001270 [Nothophytophthora sp. Chile5]
MRGGRGGGLSRKNSGGRTYRRVQASVSDSSAATEDSTSTTSSSAAKSSQSSYRSVQVVDETAGVANGKTAVAAAPAPFRSSLKDSLRQNAPPAPAKVEGKKSDRSIHAEKSRSSNRDRSRERPTSARSRSPAPHKRDLQIQASAPRGARQVISLSSPSPQKAPGQPKRFVSSLSAVTQEKVAQDMEGKTLKTPPPPIADEAERKRLADTLKERMESRKLERGSSLAQMMKAPVNRQGSLEDDSRPPEARRSPLAPRKELQNGGVSSAAAAEKEARVKEFYAKLDKDNSDSVRGTVPFKSSLTSSITPPSTQAFKSSLATSSAPSQPTRDVRTFKSSLTAAIEPSLPVATRVKKLQYSLLELKRLVAFAIPKPSDLPDMKIVEVVQSGSGGGRRDRQQGGRGGRGGGGGRGGRGGGGGRGYRPPPPPLYDGPIEPLTVSENRWKPNKEKETSGLDGMLSHVKSLLNKLTREKFAKLTNELCAIEIDSLILLRSIVAIIMDKALEEANFADVYADLCKEFHKRTFKKTWGFNRVLEDGKGLAMRAKAKMLGNIRFIGELFKVDLIKVGEAASSILRCIFYLLGLELIAGEAGQEVQAQAVRFPDEEDLEALCKMLATVGKKLDQPKTKMIMKIIILRMVELSENDKLPSRARFLIKDLLEMRDHQWEPRRKEMQQKTLDEVRREAQKLQQQGKNAQHDDLTRRRHKTQITSAQLAKQSGNLIVAQKEVVEPEHDDEPSSTELSPTQMTNRIKNIIQEYISILDLDEAVTCVQEVPVEPYHVEFAEQTINTALEGKTNEREHAVELLVGLYERGALDANSIQAALVNVMGFLEDMLIDLPLVHQYSALIFGRLVAAGCFGLSWIVSEALAHLVECKLASLVFPEVLTVLEMESDERTVLRMLADEEITPGSVLPASMRDSEADIEAYLRENGLEDFFGNGESSDEEEELDPEVAVKLRNTLEEYLSVKDKSEVVQCVEEFELPERWQHFVHVALLFSLDAKKAVRSDVAELLLQLFVDKQITTEGVEAACEPVLEDYDDLRVDTPQLAINLSELWTPLFEKRFLSPTWLSHACEHLAASGRAADVFDALFSEFETRYGQEALVAWWKTQSEVDAVWTQIEPTDKPQDERLAKWKLLLAQ